MENAAKVAEELKIEHHMAGVGKLGQRDTFAFEDRVYLNLFVDAVSADDYETAERIAKKRTRSIWVQHRGERQQLWTVAVAEEGWPVSGRIRHGEVFDRFVAPWLKERQKVAYFRMDVLRYELAVELENELSSNYETNITAVCA